MRNGRGATSIAPYSVRARKGARVSMPIDWSELDTVAPDGIVMAEALGRLGVNDPWDGFFPDRSEAEIAIKGGGRQRVTELGRQFYLPGLMEITTLKHDSLCQTLRTCRAFRMLLTSAPKAVIITV